MDAAAFRCLAGGGTPHPSTRRNGVGVDDRRSVCRVEWGACSEDGAGDGEEAVGNGAKGTGVAVTTDAEGLVLGPTSRVALHGDAGPMAGGVGAAVVGGLAAEHDLRLAGSLGHGGDATEAAERVVVSALQGFGGSSEQRGVVSHGMV